MSFHYTLNLHFSEAINMNSLYDVIAYMLTTFFRSSNEWIWFPFASSITNLRNDVNSWGKPSLLDCVFRKLKTQNCLRKENVCLVKERNDNYFFSNTSKTLQMVDLIVDSGACMQEGCWNWWCGARMKLKCQRLLCSIHSIICVPVSYKRSKLRMIYNVKESFRLLDDLMKYKMMMVIDVINTTSFVP